MRLLALETLVDGIWITDINGEIFYRNAAGAKMECMVWSRNGQAGSMQEIVIKAMLAKGSLLNGVETSKYYLSNDGALDANFSYVGMEVHSLSESDENQFGYVFQARDLSREWTREQALQERNVKLEEEYATRVKETRMQLLQAEKMASIGQLAAGVAHEINNPIGYVHSNLGTLQTYVRGLLSLLDAHDRLCQALPAELRALEAPIDELKLRVDYHFLKQDLPLLLEESREGIERVKKIVHDLRDFSHADEIKSEDWILADVHRGLESTLNIVWNDLKYKADVHKNFGVIPLIECMPSQLNQVFLNLLVNASQAIERHGQITIASHCDDEEICISIADTGQGIAADQLARIFDPFFTTKPVGKGTGLGLSLSYGIIQKHGGRIEVASTVGKGTTFRIFLPIRRSQKMNP